MKKSSTFLTVILCLILSIKNQSSQAQIISNTVQSIFQFNFNAVPVLLSGVDKAVGAKYLFHNVSATKDAIVTILSATNGAKVDILDDDSTSKPEAFSPKVSVPANSTGLVEFQIQFVTPITLLPVLQDTLYATALDIDGNATIKEIDVIDLGGGTASYQSGTPEISITQSGTAFTAKNIAGIEYTGIDTAAKQVMFTVKKNGVASFIYKAGASNANTYSISRQKSIYFKNFVYPQASVVLPVKLTSFAVSNLNSKALVKWSIATELNAKSFIVERSADGTNYTSVAEVIAKGNSNTVSSYSFTDATPSAGKSFYRLKQVDMDGNFTYSAIVLFSLDTKSGNNVSVFPNPAKGFTVASVTAVKDETIQMQLINAAGKQIFSRTEKITKGLNSITLNDLDKLVPGYYVLRVVRADETSSHPLMIL